MRGVLSSRHYRFPVYTFRRPPSLKAFNPHAFVSEQVMVDPSLEPPPSPHADPADNLACGLDRLMQDVDGGKNETPTTNGTRATTGVPEAQSKSVRVFFPAQTCPAATDIDSAPASVAQSLPDSAEGTPPAVQSEEAIALAAAKAAIAASAASQAVQPRGSLMVSPPPPPAAEETIPLAAETPMVTLSSKSPPKPTLGRKSGPKKGGARKLGAMKLGGGAGAVKLSEFAERPAAPVIAAGAVAPAADGVDADLKLARQLQDEEDARAVGGASSLIAAAASAAEFAPVPSKNGALGLGGGGPIYRSANDSSAMSTGASYSYRNGGSSSAGSGIGSGGSRSLSSFAGSSGFGSGGYGGGGGSSTFDKEKYKNVKGIGSDMLFGPQDDDPAEQQRRAMKHQEFSSSAAISSDMYFDRETVSGTGGGEVNVGLGDMAEQIAISAAAEFQGAAQAAAKLKVCFPRRQQGCASRQEVGPIVASISHKKCKVFYGVGCRTSIGVFRHVSTSVDRIFCL